MSLKWQGQQINHSAIATNNVIASVIYLPSIGEDLLNARDKL